MLYAEKRCCSLIFYPDRHRNRKEEPLMNRYLAFISYRHQERDQKISVLLRKGLENHYVPASEEVPKNRYSAQREDNSLQND